MSAHRLAAQPVDATQALNLSAGVSWPVVELESPLAQTRHTRLATDGCWRTIGHRDDPAMFGPNSLISAENSLFSESFSLLIRPGKCAKSRYRAAVFSSKSFFQRAGMPDSLRPIFEIFPFRFVRPLSFDQLMEEAHGKIEYQRNGKRCASRG